MKHIQYPTQGTCSILIDVISKLNGIRCGNKPTSCPDQLCRALEQLKKQK